VASPLPGDRWQQGAIADVPPQSRRRALPDRDRAFEADGELRRPLRQPDHVPAVRRGLAPAAAPPAGTATSADQQLRLHVYPVIGDRALGTIRPSDIQALVRRLALDLAPSTVHVIHGRVAAVFRAAARDRLIGSTPCVDIGLPRRDLYQRTWSRGAAAPLCVCLETARGLSGLPEWATPHDLRHLYASLLIRSGASVKVLQARLGHASARPTLDVYGHDEEGPHEGCDRRGARNSGRRQSAGQKGRPLRCRSRGKTPTGGGGAAPRRSPAAACR
jgi:hypothetical protein